MYHNSADIISLSSRGHRYVGVVADRPEDVSGFSTTSFENVHGEFSQIIRILSDRFGETNWDPVDNEIRRVNEEERDSKYQLAFSVPSIMCYNKEGHSETLLQIIKEMW